jgi:uncharacterized protein YndB with AHSA1/START domain/DNA-binding transcriptional ArsR family regulator
VDDDDLIFRALADPTRRRLLDLLFQRDGRTLTDLEGAFAMSRFGVSKHLGVLEEAELVLSRRVGREKLHYLNRVPVQTIYERWVSKYTQPRAEALTALRTALEGGGPMESAPRQVYQIFIKASPEQVWEGITSPAFTARYFDRVEAELVPGGDCRWVGADGKTVVSGRTLEAERPRRFVHTWRTQWNAVLAADPPSRVTWEIEPAGPGVVRLTVTHDDFPGETATFREVARGWPLVLSSLKTLLETGEPLPRAVR